MKVLNGMVEVPNLNPLAWSILDRGAICSSDWIQERIFTRLYRISQMRLVLTQRPLPVVLEELEIIYMDT